MLEDASKLPSRARPTLIGQPDFIYGEYGSFTTPASRLARVRISICAVHNI